MYVDWHPIQDVFLPHACVSAICSGSDQDEVLTEKNAGMNN